MNNAEESFYALPWAISESGNSIFWNRLDVIRVEDIFIVAVWNKQKATVIKLNTSGIYEINVSALKTTPYCLQDITIKSSLLQVFEGPQRLLFLTACGDLGAITFEELKRFQQNNKINLTQIHSFAQPHKILGSLTIHGDLLLMIKVLNRHITIDISQLHCLSNDTDVVPLVCLPLEIQQEQDGAASCVLCACDKDVSLLLTGVQDDDYKVVLVGLNTGSVYLVPLTKNVCVQPVIKKLYQAGRSVRNIITVKDKCCVFILLESGVMVVLTRVTSRIGNLEQQANDFGTLQFDMFALPGYIRTLSVALDSKSIICSDGIQCWRIKRDGDSTETTVVPVKGVMSLTMLPGLNTCLAVTKHNTFYCIDVGSNFQSKGDLEETSLQLGCDLESPYQYICELKDQTDTLVNLETSIAVEDDILEGVSLATRSDILGTKFSGRVLVYNADKPSDCDKPDRHLATDIKYKLIIEVKNKSNLEFSSVLWNMSISVTASCRGVVSKTVSLRDSLAPGSLFSTDIYVSLSTEDLASQTKVLVNLIADLPEPDRGQWISIPVIAEDLFVSYFFTVLTDSEKCAFKAQTSSLQDQINSLIQNGTSNSTNQSSYSIRLPVHLRSVADVMQLLLSKCKHRCDDYLRLLKGCVSQREVHLLAGDALITLSFNQTISTLTVVSTETRILHSVKAWIIRTLAQNNEVHCAPPAVIAKAKCIQLYLEREQLNTPTNVKNLEAIHAEVRTNVSAMLNF